MLPLLLAAGLHVSQSCVSGPRSWEAHDSREPALDGEQEAQLEFSLLSACSLEVVRFFTRNWKASCVLILFSINFLWSMVGGGTLHPWSGQ